MQQAREPAWWRAPIVNRTHAPSQQQTPCWWRNAVIYQIGPQSFQDSDGDGRGDLQGVIARLDYITSLGVDALWLTPFFASPMDDYGYDITDLYSVDPLFGSLADFDRLIALAHQRALKVVVDMVWNHTSDRHPWFRDSAASREGRYADWYVWADPGPDGGPPNNWRSAFNGDSGWKYVDARKQYYFFNFLDSQPDLNWHNPAVREMALRNARFWLDRGIDGMRLDAVNFYCHDPALRDDPVREPGARMPDGIDPQNPAARLCFVNSFCRAETLEYLAPIRALCNEYPGTMLLGEVTLCEDTIAEAARYVRGDERLHLAYHSALHFFEPLRAPRLRQIVGKALEHFDRGGACWIVGNHDYGRTRSYWGGKEQPLPEAFYKMIAALLITLPGSLCLWQGDELGLPEARIPEDIPETALQDPFGKLLYPRVKGRDGSRTPMPWQHDAQLCGFSSADAAWLPIPEAHRARAVDVQTRDPQSLLNRWRELLHWRIGQPAMQAGEVELPSFANDAVFAILRREPTQSLLCLFNVCDAAIEVDLSPYARLAPASRLTSEARFDADRRHLHMPAWAAWFADVTADEGSPA